MLSVYQEERGPRALHSAQHTPHSRGGLQGLWEAAPLCTAVPSLPSTLEAQQTQTTVNSSSEGSIFKPLTSQLFHSIKF